MILERFSIQMSCARNEKRPDVCVFYNLLKADKLQNTLRRLGVIFLAALVMTAGALEAQEPAAEPGPVLVGGVEIRLMPPGTPLERVDESDKKVQAALKAFWTDEDSLVLGVYAEASAWRQFAKGLGKNGPPADTLDFYALATSPEALADANCSEEDFLIFKNAVIRVNQTAQIMANQPRFLTFKTVITPAASPGKDSGRIRMITSVVLLEGKVIYLTIFDNDKNKFRDQTPALALAWRDACLEANRP